MVINGRDVRRREAYRDLLYYLPIIIYVCQSVRANVNIGYRFRIRMYVVVGTRLAAKKKLAHIHKWAQG